MSDEKVVVFSKKGDLTLISSDGTRFLVHSVIMSEASEVFANMFEMPQPAEASQKPAEVMLAEDAQTLQLLLQWIYPLPSRSPPPGSLEEFSPLFAVAKKYDVTMVHLRAMLTEPFKNPEPALTIFLFCVYHNLLPEGRAAARRAIMEDVDIFGTLRLSLATIDDLDLHGIDVRSPYILYAFQVDVREKVEELLRDALDQPNACTCAGCRRFSFAEWFDEGIRHELESVFSPTTPSRTFLKASFESYHEGEVWSCEQTPFDPYFEKVVKAFWAAWRGRFKMLDSRLEECAYPFLCYAFSASK